MRVNILFHKNIIRGVEPRWMIVSENKQLGMTPGLKTTRVLNEETHFNTCKEAQDFCKKHNLEVLNITEITYALSDKNMTVFVGEKSDADYSDVKSDKRAREIIFEDYGI